MPSGAQSADPATSVRGRKVRASHGSALVTTTYVLSYFCTCSSVFSVGGIFPPAGEFPPATHPLLLATTDKERERREIPSNEDVNKAVSGCPKCAWEEFFPRVGEIDARHRTLCVCPSTRRRWRRRRRQRRRPSRWRLPK